MPDLNPENLHIGRALREHRARLCVSDQQLITAHGAGVMLDVRFAENAQRASLRVIRWYHDKVMTAYQASSAGVDVAVGEREQWWVTPFDHQLWGQAVDKQRGAPWWWAQRKTQRGQGAFCYLCDRLIYTYDIGRGVTNNVRVCVMEHRAEHFFSSRPGTQSLERTTP